MQTDPSKVIEELLDQNAALRLELAVLAAMKKQMEEIEQQMSQPQEVSPELMEMISKLDIR